MATGGNLSFTGGTHTIGSGSNISNNFSVSGGTVEFTNANLYHTNFSNSGTVILDGGTNTYAISRGSSTDNSTLTIAGTLDNQGSVSQYDINVNTDKVVTTNVSDLTASHRIDNDGVLNYTGGTTANKITGDGRIVVTGYVTNTGDINQAKVNNSSVLINDGNGTTTGVINAILNNSGSLEGTGSFITKAGLSSNSGVIAQKNLTNNGTFDNNGHITLTGVLTNNSILNTDASLISATGGMVNDGTVNFTTGTNAVVITGTTTSDGTVNFHNTTGNTANITQNLVTNDGKLANNIATITANLTNTNEITGTGSIVTGTGTSTNSGTITQASLTNNGTFNNNGQMTLVTSLLTTGSLTNNATFNNNAAITGNVTNNAGATFSNDAVITGNVTNAATATFANAVGIVGDVTNNGTFDNDGSIEGAVTNSGTIDNDGVITGAITNSGTIDSIATNLAGTIENTGILTIAGGVVQDDISDVATPSGVTHITADLVNAKNITQATVNNSAALTNTGVITAAINNATTGTIDSVADNLKGAITNDGTLNLAGGTTQGAISQTAADKGNTNISADLTNSYAIAQATVTNNAALTNNATIDATTFTNNGTVTNNATITATTFTNNNGTVTNNATITATDIVNSGTISGKASDLVASNAIANTGTLKFDTASTSAATSKITGTGDVQVSANTILGGANTYTGGTLINGATLTVANQGNLSTGEVLFAGNGKLQVTGAGALSNNLSGATATDNVTVVNDAALTLNGTIGNATHFHKDGAGAMTLGMTSNTYTGNTYVDAGTLTGNTGNINNTVIGAANTTVYFTDTADAELNAISTEGTFVKSGTGVFNVANNTFSAKQADINAGTFAVNRAINADVLNMKSGTTLRGTGSISAASTSVPATAVNIASGATIAPGNSIGTLTVNGDLNLASGSTTAMEISDAASDKIVVTGATNIASGANLTVTNEDGRFFEWNSFDLVESAGNVTGTFTYDGTIANFDTSRIDVALDYSDPTKVTLTAKRKATDYSDTVAAALPRNASEAARAVDAISTGFGGDISNALLQLETLGGLNPDGVALINPNATFSSALLDLTGVLYANSALIPLMNAKTLQVYDRIAQRSGTEKKCVDCANNVWVQYYNQHDKVFSSEHSPRFTNNMSGALVGYDRAFGDILVGAYMGFGKDDLRQRHNSKMDVEDTTFGVYSGYTMGDWGFKGTLFAGTQKYHGKRYISFMDRTADGKYDGSNVGLDLEASYNIPVYSWLNVKPFAGWLNSYAHQQAFGETDAGALNLHVNSNDQFNSQARLGVRVDGQVKNRFSWYGSVAVKQFVGNDDAKLRMKLDLPNTDMKIKSAELGRTSFGGQVGVNYAITNNWSVFANADAGINNKSANCYGNVGVAYTW